MCNGRWGDIGRDGWWAACLGTNFTPKRASGPQLSTIPSGRPLLGSTDPVELVLVAEERVVVAVLALLVFGNEESPPLLAAAGGADGLTGRHICSPELVGHHVAKLLEELSGQGQGDVNVTMLLGHLGGLCCGQGAVQENSGAQEEHGWCRESGQCGWAGCRCTHPLQARSI